LLPDDLRRLVDITYYILTTCDVELSNLKEWMAAEDAQGKGRKTRNLSIYSIIIQTIFNQNGGHSAGA
jgi:hypothetical protein